jgi:predicted DNA-binding transcriptional regulator AlpA
MMTHASPIKIIKDKQVAHKLSISRTMVWHMTKSIPTFPKPISISRRSTGWFEHEIDAYLNAIAAQRTSSQNPHFSTMNL